jgi:hypothetical protein
MPAERVVLLMGQAGDRLDKDIEDLVSAACAMRPDCLLVAELPGYERGRAAGEVPALIERFAQASGMAPEAIEQFGEPRAATRHALAEARPGDLLVLLALTQRREALDLVHAFIGGGSEADG